MLADSTWLSAARIVTTSNRSVTVLFWALSLALRGSARDCLKDWYVTRCLTKALSCFRHNWSSRKFHSDTEISLSLVHIYSTLWSQKVLPIGQEWLGHLAVSRTRNVLYHLIGVAKKCCLVSFHGFSMDLPLGVLLWRLIQAITPRVLKSEIDMQNKRHNNTHPQNCYNDT